MRRMYNYSFTPRERADFRNVINANVFSSILVLIRAFTALAVPVPVTLQPPIDLLITRAHQGSPWLPGEDTAVLPSAVGHAAEAVWSSASGREVLRRGSEVQLNDSAGYFFDSLERLTTPGYLPTDQDILRARVRTTGITESTFEVQSLMFRVLDVGGQRSERKKWVHCFEAVDVLLFVIAVSEFPQRLREDEATVSPIFQRTSPHAGHRHSADSSPPLAPALRTAYRRRSWSGGRSRHRGGSAGRRWWCS